MASQDIIAEIQTALAATRSHLLDVLDAAYGHHDNWLYVRSRVLKALGRSGFEGELNRITGGYPGECKRNIGPA